MKASDFDNANPKHLGLISKERGGRPKKDPKEKQSKRVQLSFTEDEWSQIIEKAESEFRQPGQIIKLFLQQNGFFG
ncbi:MAG: hypothetical protein HQ517_04835 [SAR324 cluster bacterium]|nr:hypothetical protein [SAR324 cluster bacterium]